MKKRKKDRLRKSEKRKIECEKIDKGEKDRVRERVKRRKNDRVRKSEKREKDKV